jgi:hypothetical protein
MGCCEGDAKPGSPVDQKAMAEAILANLPVAMLGYSGSVGHQLQALQTSMPPDDGKPRLFIRPIFHPDGSIEYPQDKIITRDPKEPNGYIRDTNNRFLFHPLWGECTKRMQGLQMDPKTAEVDVKMVCSHPETPHSMKFVTALNCSECPLRSLPIRKNPA